MSRVQALIPLLLSCAIINGLHFYLLISQRSDRKPTISEHAILNKFTHRLFFICHIVGISMYALFGYVFYTHFGLHYLFYLTLVVAFLDVAMAYLPASGKTVKAHLVIAYSMGAIALITTTSATISINQPHYIKLLCLTVLLYIFNTNKNHVSANKYLP